MKPKYSILITNYNTIYTLIQSLESILNQIDNTFEIVVVDNNSHDGSNEILKNYGKKGYIKLISVKCSRGRGRQIAFENSKGEIVITNMDMDTIFKPKLTKVLELYKQHEKDYLLFKGGAIISRKLIKKVGGWHDLQRGEDTELVIRLKDIGVESMDSGIDIVETHFLSWDQKGYIYILYDRYILLRDKMRVGMKMNELYNSTMRENLWKTRYGAVVFVALLFLAKVTYKFKECYNE
jgi:glycosyltransferase involved in cell wall biosynthesis